MIAANPARAVIWTLRIRTVKYRANQVIFCNRLNMPALDLERLPCRWCR